MTSPAFNAERNGRPFSKGGFEEIDLVGLRAVMDRSAGSSAVSIGLIDGPVARHASFAQQPQVIGDSAGRASDFASLHGTFVAGILGARRGSGAPGICPDCTLYSHPAFAASPGSPFLNGQALSRAIRDCVGAGVKVINLSLTVYRPSAESESSLRDALDLAAHKGVIVVAAAGNQASVSATVITRHPWVIPVAGCDPQGRPSTGTNLGLSIGRRGLRAPGEQVTSLALTGTTVLNGTSVAAPFVTGAIALLWSEFPRASAQALKLAILRAERRSSISPPLLNGLESLKLLH